MNSYDIGDLAHCTGSFTTSAGVPTDPTAVFCSVTTPSGVATLYNFGDGLLQKSSTGNYFVDVAATERGIWNYRFYSTGTGQAAVEGQFFVRGLSLTSLITLAELRTFPGFSSVPDTEDATLEDLINAVTEDFETHWENFGVQRSVVEDYTYREIMAGSSGRFAYGEMATALGDLARGANIVWLRHFPVVSVTSIVDQKGNTVDPTWYWIDKDHGALRTLFGWIIPQDASGFMTYWTITYTAGRVATTALVPSNIKLACKMWVAQLYKDPTQNIQSKRVGDLSITYRNAANNQGYVGGLPDQIRRMISRWKKEDA